MGEKHLTGNPPEKVCLMYQAVVEMLNENCDINTMKVSDITARAGIGKGTAYEYFTSKEELITRAIIYDVTEKIELMKQIIEGSGNFRQKVEAILDFIAEKFGENQTFCTLVRMGTGSYEIAESLKDECRKVQDSIGGNQIEEIMDLIMEQGAREGAFGEENIFLRRMAFSSQMLGFATYLVAVSQDKNILLTVEEAKNFILDSLVKSLNS